jgi:N-acetylglucosaminyl-diphospho-decaprenol L-rhamnosyltransferase
VIVLDLGIVVVNYNVRDLLRDCLASVYDSRGDFTFETCVVDNASSDGSAGMVITDFPQARLIRADNEGYAAGNNLGLQAFGFGVEQAPAVSEPRFILFLNPDTVLPPSALADMLAFMEEHPNAGAAGPRLVREDGTLDKACRRSFPTPQVSAYRMSGLSRLFPKSPRFGRYNLTYLPEDLTTEVDSVVGAFMMVRGPTLIETGLMDEQFFMYAEDLDLCYRMKQKGGRHRPALQGAVESPA